MIESLPPERFDSPFSFLGNQARDIHGLYALGKRNPGRVVFHLNVIFCQMAKVLSHLKTWC